MDKKKIILSIIVISLLVLVIIAAVIYKLVDQGAFGAKENPDNNVGIYVDEDYVIIDAPEKAEVLTPDYDLEEKIEVYDLPTATYEELTQEQKEEIPYIYYKKDLNNNNLENQVTEEDIKNIAEKDEYFTYRIKQIAEGEITPFQKSIMENEGTDEPPALDYFEYQGYTCNLETKVCDVYMNSDYEYPLELLYEGLEAK